MSNGAQCCALEICCPPSDARAKTIAAMAAGTGVDADYCAKVMDWLDAEGLVFAPASVKPFIAEIAKIAHAHPVV